MSGKHIDTVYTAVSRLFLYLVAAAVVILIVRMVIRRRRDQRADGEPAYPADQHGADHTYQRMVE